MEDFSSGPLPFLVANGQNVHAMILRLRVRGSQRIVQRRAAVEVCSLYGHVVGAGMTAGCSGNGARTGLRRLEACTTMLSPVVAQVSSAPAESAGHHRPTVVNRVVRACGAECCIRLRLPCLSIQVSAAPRSPAIRSPALSRRRAAK